MMQNFLLINPIDFRYMRGDLGKKASQYLSEEAKIRYELQVEVAYVKALAKLGLCKHAIVKEVAAAAKKIHAEQVYKEEEKIKHETKALVKLLSESVSNDAKPYIHLGLTSYDVLDTANALRYKHFVELVLLPELKSLEKVLISLALRYKATPQIGRTHGQHAEPITFGFALAQYVSRIGDRILAIESASSRLRGKLSGPVGAYNAMTLFCKDPEKLEMLVLKNLGLKAAQCSTQIVPREALADLMHAIVSTMSVLANLADDFRNLQRSEIAELAEYFEVKSQVGSSSMPHKRNPIAFENIKSFWKIFAPRMLTAYMDQISEHQRDLTNSASERFIPELLFACTYASNRMRSALSRLYVDSSAMMQNLKKSQDIIAEPLYVLLSLQGVQNAHEKLRRIVQRTPNSASLIELVLKDKSLGKYLRSVPKRQLQLLQNPERYTGLAEKKAVKVCAYWKKKLRF